MTPITTPQQKFGVNVAPSATTAPNLGVDGATAGWAVSR